MKFKVGDIFEYKYSFFGSEYWRPVKVSRVNTLHSFGTNPIVDSIDIKYLDFSDFSYFSHKKETIPLHDDIGKKVRFDPNIIMKWIV